MEKRWRFLPHDSAQVSHLARQARVSPVVAQLLLCRGVCEPAAATTFLAAKLTDLHDPSLLPGVQQAVDVLHSVIESGEPICVYGDYDADGMTAAAILVRGLKLLGADVSYHVPNRLEDAYGLSTAAIEKLASRGKKAIITVDCGITSTREAELCRRLGMKLVITDHHRTSHELPDADAVIHPRLPGSDYPFGDLCGAGVAFKLAWALCQKASGSQRVTDRLRKYLMQSLGLAAIGTVADVVPLVNENRVLVTHGLKTLLADPVPGIAHLMQITGLDKKPRLCSEDLSFTLAPRLNASGRLGQAQLGIELLSTDSPERAAALADYIHQLNSSRESLERSVLLAAQKQIKEEFDPYSDPALVLAGSGWHAGVIGVVAGRLAEKYARPVVMVSIDPTGAKHAVGSARSGCAVDLHAALAQCTERLVAHGGHAAAAGLRIEENQLEAFRGDFCEVVAGLVAEIDTTPEVLIDAESSLGLLNLATVQQIESLAPFGEGNHRPVLCASGVMLAEPPRRMGGGERHLSARLSQDGHTTRAVAFGQGEWADMLTEHEGPIDIAFRPVINEFRGRRNVEIHLVDWRASRVGSALTPG